MLKNAISDAKICTDFAKILIKFSQSFHRMDSMDMEVWVRGLADRVARSAHLEEGISEAEAAGRATTPSLFPRLVRGWINPDVRAQIHIFQHFSRSTRISSSRKQICQKIKISKNFVKFENSLENFQLFAKFCRF